MGSLKGGGTLYPFFLLGVYAWVGEEGPPMLTAGSQWGRVLGVISGAGGMWPQPSVATVPVPALQKRLGKEDADGGQTLRLCPVGSPELCGPQPHGVAAPLRTLVPPSLVWFRSQAPPPGPR